MVTTIQPRTDKALELTKQPNSVRPMADGRYWVQSQSARNLGYLVTPTAGTCTCKDFEKRGVLCKHLLAAQEAAFRAGRVRILEYSTTTGQVIRWQPVSRMGETLAKDKRSTEELIRELWG